MWNWSYTVYLIIQKHYFFLVLDFCLLKFNNQRVLFHIPLYSKQANNKFVLIWQKLSIKTTQTIYLKCLPEIIKLLQQAQASADSNLNMLMICCLRRRCGKSHVHVDLQLLPVIRHSMHLSFTLSICVLPHVVLTDVPRIPFLEVCGADIVSDCHLQLYTI